MSKKNIGLDTESTRNTIFKYLGKSNLGQSHTYEVINSVKDLDTIREGEYIMCPRFNGTRSWVIFFYDNNTDIHYAVNFPKHNIRKRDEITIHPTNVTAATSIYQGTIMEGIYYQEEGVKYIIIDDIYMYAGNDQTLKSRSDRLKLLSNGSKITSTGGSMYIYACNTYRINKDSIMSLYDLIKTDRRIQEITFFPDNFGKKIFTYAITSADLIERVIHIETFLMQKTSRTDVYEMVIPKTTEKIGIAYIPDIETSKMCKSWFQIHKKKSILVKFQKNSVNDKWTPIEVV